MFAGKPKRRGAGENLGEPLDAATKSARSAALSVQHSRIEESSRLCSSNPSPGSLCRRKSCGSVCGFLEKPSGPRGKK